MYKKILLPTDGSEISYKAAEHAIWIANAACAEIIVLNVIEARYLQALPEDQLISQIDELLRRDAENSVNKISGILKESQSEGKCGKIKISSKTTEGNPADEILKISEEEDIDLVVMGASGKHGLDRFLLGSTTERVVRSAKCSVLAVH